MTSSTSRPITRLALVAGLTAATLTLTSPAQAQKIRPEFFGMHDTQIASGSVPDVQLGSIRLWDTGTSWRHVEIAPFVYDWSDVTAAVDTATSAGLRPMLVLGQTPQFWASPEEMFEPGAYGDGASSMPDLEAWKRYVAAAAEQYGNRVDYQIWNEPNVTNYWSGSVSQMARLTATASREIRRVVGKEKATVVAPSFPLRLKGQRQWYDAYWSSKVDGKSMAAYVDVVSANPYPLAGQGPEGSMKLLGFATRALPRSARGKPLWNTEINYGLLGGGETAKEIPEAQQAAFVARTLLLNAASTVRRMYWYSWGQGPIANTHLVEGDRTTLTRAGQAWRVAHGWLAGTNVQGCTRDSKGRLKGLYTCTARASRREVRRVYWKPSGRRVKVTTHRTTTKRTDLSGRTTRRKGPYRLTVGQSPVMVTSRR